MTCGREELRDLGRNKSTGMRSQGHWADAVESAQKFVPDFQHRLGLASAKDLGSRDHGCGWKFSRTVAGVVVARSCRNGPAAASWWLAGRDRW